MIIGIAMKVIAYIAGKEKPWARRLNKVGNVIISVSVGILVFMLLLCVWSAGIGC